MPPRLVTWTPLSKSSLILGGSAFTQRNSGGFVVSKEAEEGISGTVKVVAPERNKYISKS